MVVFHIIHCTIAIAWLSCTAHYYILQATIPVHHYLIVFFDSLFLLRMATLHCTMSAATVSSQSSTLCSLPDAASTSLTRYGRGNRDGGGVCYSSEDSHLNPGCSYDQNYVHVQSCITSFWSSVYNIILYVYHLFPLGRMAPLHFT